jgi:hypothetical protein
MVVELYARLLEEALHGRQAMAELPGGEATVALSPWSFGAGDIAAPEWAAWRRYSAENVLDSDWHPIHTLESWGVMWREWTGAPEPTVPATITACVDYLKAHLHEVNEAAPRDGIWPPGYLDLAADVAMVVARLENILIDGERRQSGAPCLRCSTNLIRLVDDETGALTDDWGCPRCHRTYNPDQYRNAVAAGYAAAQVEVITDPVGRRTTWGTVARAAQDAHRPERTIRSWVHREKVATACLVAGRRLVVSIDDAVAQAEVSRRVVFSYRG